METPACGDERPRFHVRMMFMIVLGKVQGHWTIGFAVNELLHFGIGMGADFVGSTLRENPPASEHNHSRRDAEGARHVVMDDDRRTAQRFLPSEHSVYDWGC